MRAEGRKADEARLGFRLSGDARFQILERAMLGPATSYRICASKETTRFFLGVVECGISVARLTEASTLSIYGLPAGGRWPRPPKQRPQCPKPLARNSRQIASPRVNANSAHTIQFMTPSPLFVADGGQFTDIRSDGLTILKPPLAACWERGRAPVVDFWRLIGGRLVLTANSFWLSITGLIATNRYPANDKEYSSRQ